MASIFHRRRVPGLVVFAALGAALGSAVVRAESPAAHPRPDAAPVAAASPAAADDAGAKLYQMACATCHMPDGSGVPGMQPALAGSKVVAGPAATVIKVVLLGPDKALPPHKAMSGNQMPAFDSLSDEEVASVVSYVRKTFGKGASAVTAAQVKAQRPKK